MKVAIIGMVVASLLFVIDSASDGRSTSSNWILDLELSPSRTHYKGVSAYFGPDPASKKAYRQWSRGQAWVCPDKGQYSCVVMDNFVFAMPVGDSRRIESWRFDAFFFDILPDVRVPSEIENRFEPYDIVISIRQPLSAQPVCSWAFYSYSRGLVGYIEANAPHCFMLDGVDMSTAMVFIPTPESIRTPPASMDLKSAPTGSVLSLEQVEFLASYELSNSGWLQRNLCLYREQCEL